MKQRLFSFLLAVTLILGCLPLSVSAGGTVAVAVDETIAAFDDGFAAVKKDGSVWAWGDLEYVDTSYSPQKISGENETYMTLSGVSSYVIRNKVLAIDSSGSMWTNDSIKYDSVSDGALVKIRDNVVDACMGASNYFFIKNDKSLWGWGDNYYGALGDGTREDRTEPVKIMDDVVKVSSNGKCTFAIKSDGTLWGWGYKYGGIGDGSGKWDTLSPKIILDNVIAVDAGKERTLAVTADGKLWCWGEFDINDDNSIPFQVTVDNVVDAYVESTDNYEGLNERYTDSFVYLKKDGTLWTRTREYLHYVTYTTPEKIMDDVVSFCARNGSYMALRADGSVWTWGKNNNGQLGDGTTENKDYPVRILDGVKVPIKLPDVPVPPTPVDESVSVYFLSGWDATTRTAKFGDNTLLSLETYTVADSVDVSNISELLNKYVLVTMEEGDSSLEYTITDIQPVESKIGTVTTVGEHFLTIDGTTYPVREDFILGGYEGKEILYHTYNGTIVGLSALEKKTGTLDAWDSTTGRATIDGTSYPTNYMSDLSFQNNINEYLGQTIEYSVCGTSDYKPLISVAGVVEEESVIAVFSSEKSLTVKTGYSMWLGFGKIADGEIVGDWEKMAVVVSDPTVIALSDYEETEYGYSLKVTGRKQGSTNVTITDTQSGAHTVIVITVRDSYVGTYSYAVDSMETFYPDNKWENSIQTNIYNLNGLYVNNYKASKTGTSYTVTFDVYNSRYHTGAVDIYDADGNWVDCEEIKKYSMISSLWDTGEQAYYLISDAAKGKLLTYEQASFAKHTPISIEVPDGGYFTISNNFAESPGTFLFNTCDIIFSATNKLIDAGLDIDVDKKETQLTAFTKLLKGQITDDKTTREKFMSVFESTAKSQIRSCGAKIITNSIDEGYSDIVQLFENTIISQLTGIKWKDIFKTATDIGESAFKEFTGPAGAALKGCFAFSKGSSQLLQAVHLAVSIDDPYATVFTSIDEGSINPHGVIVNTNGNMDTEAELHVFRVSNDNTIEVILNESGDDHLKKYELYNICFVKNDQLVQPNGRVTVRIPIPDGMKRNTCNVYRQESDGKWTILTARIEGNYLVFETDHFSLYGVVGDLEGLSISSLPNKTTYTVGDTLEPNGLVLSLDGGLITEGYICDPTVLSEAGTQKITVSYGHAFSEFEVSVQKESTTITGVTANANLTYTGKPQAGYAGTPTSAYAESYDISYKGRNATTYNSRTAPTAAGDYTVTIKIPDSDTTYTGSISLDFTIAKAAQSAPAVPKLNNKTSTSVTLKAIATNENGATAQYSKDSGITWQDSPAFAGLSSGTEYSFVARYAATSNYETSLASPVLKVTTDVAPSGGGATSDGSSGGGTTPPDSTDGNGDDPQEPTISFTDVAPGAWYYDAVQYVAEHDLMNGYGNGIFGPKDSVTRGQFAQIIYNKEGKPAVANVSDFTDVVSNAWYYNAVTWAADNKVVSGYGNGKYGPSDYITREQLVTMLYRYARAIGADTKASMGLGSFPDFREVTDYAEMAMKWAVAEGFVSGREQNDGNYIAPKGTATRAEVAAILTRFVEFLKQ